MSTYRREWDCCGSVTETDAWEPEFCPFCVNAECAAPSAANGAEMPELTMEEVAQALRNGFITEYGKGQMLNGEPVNFNLRQLTDLVNAQRADAIRART